MTEIYWTNDKFIGIGILCGLMFSISFVLLSVASFATGSKMDFIQTIGFSVGITVIGLIFYGINALLEYRSIKNVEPE
jgi:ABC-type transport system involved in multi-copper enzyme maturation permease subunit